MLEDEEAHPSWGMARFNRVSSHPGQRMFDSDIRHSHYIVLTISEGLRSRSLNSDFLRAGREKIEVRMSESQFGALVSSFGQGRGVPVTIQYIDQMRVEEAPEDESRLNLSVAETRSSADKALSEIVEAEKRLQEALDQKPTKIKEVRAAAQSLHFAIQNAPKNIEFAAKQLIEHTETTINKAKADIEAMVDDRARDLGFSVEQLGINKILEIEANTTTTGESNEH